MAEADNPIEWLKHVLEDAQARAQKLYDDLEAARLDKTRLENDLAAARAAADAPEDDSAEKEAERLRAELAQLRERYLECVEQKQGAQRAAIESEEHAKNLARGHVAALQDARTEVRARQEALAKEHGELVTAVVHGLGGMLHEDGESIEGMTPIQIVKRWTELLRANDASTLAAKAAVIEDADSGSSARA